MRNTTTTSMFMHNRQERHHLSHQNRSISEENKMLKETMVARTTTMINERHNNSFKSIGTVQLTPEKKKFDGLLETIHSNHKYQKFSLYTRKDINDSIKKNELVLNRNQHKIKQLDSHYKRIMVRDLKQETQELWRVVRLKNEKGSQTQSQLSKRNCRSLQRKERPTSSSRSSKRSRGPSSRSSWPKRSCESRWSSKKSKSARSAKS